MTRPNSYFDRLRRRPNRVKIVTQLGVKGAKRFVKNVQAETSIASDEPRYGLILSAIGPEAEF